MTKWPVINSGTFVPVDRSRTSRSARRRSTFTFHQRNPRRLRIVSTTDVTTRIIVCHHGVTRARAWCVTLFVLDATVGPTRATTRWQLNPSPLDTDTDTHQVRPRHIVTWGGNDADEKQRRVDTVGRWTHGRDTPATRRRASPCHSRKMRETSIFWTCPWMNMEHKSARGPGIRSRDSFLRSSGSRSLAPAGLCVSLRVRTGFAGHPNFPL